MQPRRVVDRHDVLPGAALPASPLSYPFLKQEPTRPTVGGSPWVSAATGGGGDFSFDALEAGDTAEGLFDFVYGKREILGVTDLFLTPWTLALVRWICKFALFPLVERLGLSFV